MQTEWCKTILYWQLQNIVHWFAVLQLSLPTIPTAQPSLSFGWHVVTSRKLTVIIGTFKLLLLYVPKNYIMCTEFFADKIILWILWVRIKNSEWQVHENASRNNMIMCSLFCQFFGIRRNNQYLHENDL